MINKSMLVVNDSFEQSIDSYYTNIILLIPGDCGHDVLNFMPYGPNAAEITQINESILFTISLIKDLNQGTINN